MVSQLAYVKAHPTQRVIKRTVLDAGIRSEIPEKERLVLFSGHSLRAGLASSAEVTERYVQK